MRGPQLALLFTLLSRALCEPIVAEPTTLKGLLAAHGLEAYDAKIKALGVDTPADVEFLRDADIDSLWMPVVKRNVLKKLALAKKVRRQQEQTNASRGARWQTKLLGDVVSTLETLLRGFFLGFGLSTVYEMLVVSKDFYTAMEDVGQRVRRAALRACVLGTATALVLVGSAIVIPSPLRASWMEGSIGVMGAECAVSI